MNKNVLVLFAHPSTHHSRVNKAMIEAIQGLDYVTVHDLYEKYPDFYIDVNEEKSLLLKADLLVLQHPLYWYSTPPMLKLWQDVVLEKGFAYGPGGTLLQGKDFLLAVSCGGKRETYQTDGYHFFTLQELLRPLQATARLCGMRYRQPVLLQGSFDCDEKDIQVHASHYARLLQQYVVQGHAIFDQPSPKKPPPELNP